MPNILNVRYTCDTCISTRNLQLEVEKQEQNLYYLSNSSGLFMYSDIHRCQNGVLGINNLHIDHNSDVRSYEFLKLPTEKNNRKIMAGLPSPSTKVPEFKTYRITSMASQLEFRLTIIDKYLGVHLIVGNTEENIEDPVFSISSSNHGVVLHYYEGEIPDTDNVKKWLQTLIDLIEILPPTKIGFFIDTLRYISTLLNIPPTPFHINMLKTILSSHKVNFTIKPDVNITETLEDSVDLYGEEMVQSMSSLIEELKGSPNSSLQEFTRSQRREVSDLVYMFLLLEQDGLIEFQRPPEVEIE